MLKNYLLTAYKVFMRRKLFTLINLLCIVLTLVILMVVTALLDSAFRPSGVEGRSDRYLQIIMMSAQGDHGESNRNGPMGYRIIDKFMKPLKTPALVSAVGLPQTVSVYQGEQVSQVMLRNVDAEYWRILDFKVLAGRVPSSEDVAQGRFVSVLNASTARKLFGAGQPLGQRINVAGQVFEVIGVVEDALQINAYADIWVPLTTAPSTEYRHQDWGNFSVLLMARDAGGLDAIRHEVQEVSKQIKVDGFDQAWLWADSKLDVFARLVTGSQPSDPDSGAHILLSVIGGLMLLFMLLPALNLVNLNTGRILERGAEIGVRKAFGATSRQLVGQLVIENLLLCLAGGLISLAFTQLALGWLEGSGLIPYLKVSLNWTVFAYGMMITTVFGLLSGVIPAWKMSRLDPVFALKGAA